MAIRHQRSVWVGLVAAAAALAACATPAVSARPGELEVRADPDASYALNGRFHVNAIEPWSPSRDIDFDPSTSSARIELPPGSFTLTLAAGARLVCAGEEQEPFASPQAVPRLVSAAPQIISITPGERTVAHIAFGGSPDARREDGLVADTESSSGEPDPCGSRMQINGAVAAWN